MANDNAALYKERLDQVRVIDCRSILVQVQVFWKLTGRVACNEES